MVQQRRQCCFCENPANSKEHYYSQWLKAAILKENPNLTKATTMHLIWNRAEIPYKGRHFNQGHPVSRSVRSVCQDCNKGWMSKIQEASKDTILPLATGYWPSMNEGSYKLVATWLTMFSFSVDQVQDSISVASIQDRYKFREQKAPLDNWEIRIGVVDSPVMDVSFNHFSFASAQWMDTPEFHVTFARLGKLFVFISNLKRVDVVSNLEPFFRALDKLGMVTIWPSLCLPPYSSGLIREEQTLSLVEHFHSIGQAARRDVEADLEL